MYLADGDAFDQQELQIDYTVEEEQIQDTSKQLGYEVGDHQHPEQLPLKAPSFGTMRMTWISSAEKSDRLSMADGRNTRQNHFTAED